MERGRMQLQGTKLALAILAATVALTVPPPTHAQKAFPTPEAAAEALVDGVARHDDDAVKAVLGPDYAKYLPARAVQEDDVTNFLEAWARKHGILRKGDDRAFVEVGTHGWTMPIPLVRRGAGWAFDTKGAPEEMRVRRIGRNELDAIKVVLAMGDAQEEYASADRNGDGVKSYTAKFVSTAGKRDGLYWPTLSDERPSPLGPVAAAGAKAGEPFHGYDYRILTAQGPSAPGGAKSYVVNGAMTGGYAIVAWPAKYGDTGVMTFIVGRDGVVHEKDLGPGTASIARAMKAYDPDSTWTKSALPD
jgi:Protein of unknown function (DUF2950)